MARGKPDGGERLFCAIRDQFSGQDVSPNLLGFAFMEALDIGKWEKASPMVQDFLAAVEKQLRL